MDECKHCGYRGDIEKCRSVECSKHHTWYVEQLRAELASIRNAVQECFSGMSNMASDGTLLLSADSFEKFNEMDEQARESKSNE